MSQSTATPSQDARAPDKTQRLRDERDRFVAFAFCDADMLLELDQAHRVCFAAGATSALLGAAPDALNGRDVLELFAPECHIMVEQLLRILEDGHRLEPVFIRLQGTRGPSPPVTMIGYQLRDFKQHCFLALRLGPPMPSHRPPGAVARDGETGLVAADGLEELVSGRIGAITSADAAHQLTVLSFEEFGKLRRRLDEETRPQMMSTVGAVLKSGSLFGDSATRLDDNSFGVIHSADADIGELEIRIEEVTRKFDPEGKGVLVRSASTSIDCDGLSEEDAAGALVYGLKSLSEARADGDDDQPLAEKVIERIGESGRLVEAVREIVRNRRMATAFQPIVRLADNRPVSFEVLARFTHAGFQMSAQQFFSIAEEIGVAAEFDVAMCETILDWLYGGEGSKCQLPVAINLNVETIRSQGASERLFEMLDRHENLPKRLGFEIRDTALADNLTKAQAFVSRLRGKGFRICVDKFGAGPSAFNNLRKIEIDAVKIDSSYARDAMSVRGGAAFVRALGVLCQDLKIDAIAEIFDDVRAVSLLQKCGIAYGQGFSLCEPAADPLPLTVAKSAPKSSGWSEKSWSSG